MNANEIANLEDKLSKIVQMHSSIVNIDNSLNKLYPITIVENNTFYVFDYEKPNNKYKYIMEQSLPNISIPSDIMACFPLDFYDMKASAVISTSALDNIVGNTLIFHEFVHCYQYENYENDIKNTLQLHMQNMKIDNYMWEINYAFPYDDIYFINKVEELNTHYMTNDTKNIKLFYKAMKDYLKQEDYEYMIWQEWKEGYARYVENKIRTHYNLDISKNEIVEPFDRVPFYELGSRHIDLIINTLNISQLDMKKLFDLIG